MSDIFSIALGVLTQWQVWAVILAVLLFGALLRTIAVGGTAKRGGGFGRLARPVKKPGAQKPAPKKEKAPAGEGSEEESGVGEESGIEEEAYPAEEEGASPKKGKKK
jgi:hypothetical protein